MATAVDDGAVVFGEARRPFDLLLSVPPHRPPTVVAASGLTGGGPWIKVDPRTLETRWAAVRPTILSSDWEYAVGPRRLVRWQAVRAEVETVTEQNSAPAGRSVPGLSATIDRARPSGHALRTEGDHFD